MKWSAENMDYISTAEAAKLWGVTVRYVQKLIADGRVPGAKKYGVSWMLPADSEKPRDPRRTDANTEQLGACSFFPMLNLRGGDVDGARRACKSDGERALLSAQLSVFCCEAQRAPEALKLLEGAAEPSLKLGAGIVKALSAMSLGDADAWSRALAEIEAVRLSENRAYERELTLALLNTGMHDKSPCPEWLRRGDFTGIRPELFPLARYLYVKNAYLNWKEIDLVVIAEPLISECYREKSDLAEIYLRLLAAVAYHDLGKDGEASSHMLAAAAVADRSGLYQPFVDYHHTVGRLMDDCLRDTHPRLFSTVQRLGGRFWNNWVEIYNDFWNQPMASGLSPRELEAARLVSRGLTAREIAKRMGISQSSVKKYLNVAYSKMHISSKEELRRLVHV